MSWVPRLDLLIGSKRKETTMRTTALRYAAPVLLLAGGLAACGQSIPSAGLGGPPGGPSVSDPTGTTATAASADRAKAADVRNIIRTAMDTYKLRAVIARVTIDGKNVITEAFGNSMTGVPASTDMHFRNGSVAESYIANLLLQLVDEKKISLDDKISTWLPDLPHADEVSLGNLISMTSGYHDFVPNAEFLKINDTQPYKTWTPDEILTYANLDQPLLYTPGTNWNYAHTNFVILGMALDKINGRPLNDVLQDKVLGPLGLTNTTDPGGPVIAEPVLHAWDSEQRSVYSIPASLPFYVDSTGWDTSWSLSRGAIQTSNIFDLDTTAIAVGNGKLLSPESFKAMTNTKMAHQGGPTPECKQCQRGFDAYTYGMGVVMKGNWLLQDPLVNGYSALEAYLPSQRIAISLVVTFAEGAFDKTTGSYPNEAVPIFEQIGAKLAPNDAPPPAPGDQTPPPGG
jgi:CubicO group peptidase (beta-lactamase class C family)